ncbi:SOS response-associated peptidase [Bacillus sp. FJAT-27251]|uniref:SOS response-associated peptidase n=1 Tax=Bacillus sp. FJAT-27251 TaxID=1684142 RepID=UPI0006A790CA|nr:SOS response-associated peptidase [Bacillus sp. FJAT-27251]
MCGRFSLFEDVEQLMQQFGFEFAGEWDARFNVAPSQQVLAVAPGRDGRRKGAMLRWGLVPFWAEDEKIGYKMINARAETIEQKASFKGPLKKRRCLILADGFYEWKRIGKDKQPFRFMMKDEQPFAFAGLWETWKKGGVAIHSCTIITTEANALVEDVHDRMPVILGKDHQQIWLDPTVEEPAVLKPLLVPYKSELMKAYEVSSLVNSPKNDIRDVALPLNSK